MKNMSADDIKRQMSAAQSQLGSRNSYMLQGAETLKSEGNVLVGQKRYAEAALKYERVKNNLSADFSPEAEKLKFSSILNLQLCYLKQGEYQKCIDCCNEALVKDKTNVKAYTRRGLARKEMGLKAAAGSEVAQQHLLQAQADFQKALKRVPEDGAINGYAAEVEAAISAASIAPTELPAEAEDCPAAPVFDGPGAVELAKKDPGALKSAASMLKGMSPEQIDEMAKDVPGGVSPEMLRQSAAMMENMGEKELQNMMEIAGKMQDSGLMPKNLGRTDVNGKDVVNHADAMAKAQELVNNPAMMESMGKILADMSPELLESMSKTAGYSISKDQAEKTAEMMKTIKPETMQRVIRAAGFMQRVYLKARAVYNRFKQYKMIVLALLVVTVAYYFNSHFLAEPSAPAVALSPEAVGAMLSPEDDELVAGVIDPGESVPSFGSSN